MSNFPNYFSIKNLFLFRACLLIACAQIVPSRVLAADEVRMTLNGESARPGDYSPNDVKSLILDNGLLKITFGHDVRNDISATSVIKNHQELAHNLHGVVPRDTDAERTFYHDYNASGGYMHARIVRIVKNTPELVHFALIDTNAPELEDHYVMLKGESGIHPYVIIQGRSGGEMRTMYRFDMDILDWAYSGERIGHQPKYELLQSISERGNVGDETWKLPDGSIYQKYDYCLYYSETPMWGDLGHGFGVFFMPVSTESYAGGPLRQELAVHQDALILNYIGGGHFNGGGGAGGLTGQKIHGPWFLYFNTGDTTDAIIADAKKTAEAEKKKWPYQWVEEPLYPVKRTTVTGQLKISHDRSAAYAYIILGQPTNSASGRGGGGGRRGGFGGANSNSAVDRASILYTQSGDYIYYVKADADGKFTLPAVRPGTYTLYAWQTQGPITESFARDGIVVTGDTLDLGAVAWDPPWHSNLLWQIGKPDRMAGEFKFGDQPRTSQWMLQVPADLTFTIGKSKEASDWYYAQKSGVWTVKFNLDKTFSGNAYLTIAIAGGGGRVAVSMNDTNIGNLSYGDDASVRRAANRSGRYARNEFTFPASALKQGENTLILHNNGGGLMYDTIVLEADSSL
jgi:rhamnogalacturonan endolyase